MHTTNISNFRANLLKYLEIANTGEKISVTSNGKLLATVAPPINQKEQARKKLNELATKAKVHDVTSPVESDWNTLS